MSRIVKKLRKHIVQIKLDHQQFMALKREAAKSGHEYASSLGKTLIVAYLEKLNGKK